MITSNKNMIKNIILAIFIHKISIRSDFMNLKLAGDATELTVRPPYIIFS